jgi:hypothetical protein
MQDAVMLRAELKREDGDRVVVRVLLPVLVCDPVLVKLRQIGIRAA